jgi:ubiquinone/menaquinone biosynthesis C-methylase UbiE
MRRLAVLTLSCLALYGQAATDANQRYQTHEGRMGVAKTLGAADREQRQKPQQLVDAMELRQGMTVADIGTGVGYMLPYLSKAVGSQGRVLAEDIFDDFLAQAKSRVAEEKLSNVTFIKGNDRSPELPANSVDVALALDSYHHYDYPAEMLAGIHKALKPAGRLVLVEFYKRKDAMPGNNAMQHIRLDKADAVKEIQAAGFRLVSSQDHIPNSQYMAVFEKK